MPKASPPDAIRLLIDDHKAVQKLFDEYDTLHESEGSDDEKQALAQRICSMLTVHTTLEEELFYPAARDALEQDDLVDEAVVEHASAKDLIAQIRDGDPADDLYDAKVTVLGEYIKHHVKEEEKEMFPLLRKTAFDGASLGVLMQERKQQLQTEAEEQAA